MTGSRVNVELNKKNSESSSRLTTRENSKRKLTEEQKSLSQHSVFKRNHTHEKTDSFSLDIASDDHGCMPCKIT